MLKSAIFSILFLASGVIASPQSPNSRDLLKESETTEFWNNIRVMPVQFLDKSNDQDGNTHFSAIFASNFRVERINFILLTETGEEKKNAFFKRGKEWEEEIDRKEFLKKFKKDFWLTTYLKTEQENIIIAAHQFKEWQALGLSYAGHPEHLRRNTHDLEFWQDIRMGIITFYAIEKDKAYWLFLKQIDKTEPLLETDRTLIPLANGKVVQKRLTAANEYADFRILEQGVFNIQKNTVFQKQETENSKPRKMLKLTIIDGKLRLRSLLLEKDYFLNNFSKHYWICFYDSKHQSLVRVVRAMEEKLD